jgi:hypothetical protein
MKKNGKSFDYKIYAGAGCAFSSDTGELDNADAAKDGRARSPFSGRA